MGKVHSVWFKNKDADNYANDLCILLLPSYQVVQFFYFKVSHHPLDLYNLARVRLGQKAHNYFFLTTAPS